MSKYSKNGKSTQITNIHIEKHTDALFILANTQKKGIYIIYNTLFLSIRD